MAWCEEKRLSLFLEGHKGEGKEGILSSFLPVLRILFLCIAKRYGPSGALQRRSMLPSRTRKGGGILLSPGLPVKKGEKGNLSPDSPTRKN